MSTECDLRRSCHADADKGIRLSVIQAGPPGRQETRESFLLMGAPRRRAAAALACAAALAAAAPAARYDQACMPGLLAGPNSPSDVPIFDFRHALTWRCVPDGG